MKNITLDEVIRENLKDQEFKKEWDESEAQYQITRQMIKARIEQGLSQKRRVCRSSGQSSSRYGKKARNSIRQLNAL